METEYLIAVEDFCASHDIEIAFISSLHETGLIEVVRIEEAEFLDAEQLQELEKYIRFYYELNINLEGIDSIKHLLQRVNTMHHEIAVLRNRLRLYEEDSQ
mgnify:FL=1|jgi:hypothetical protein